jgi:hypothetical protein
MTRTTRLRDDPFRVDPKIRFLSASEYRMACRLWAELAIDVTDRLAPTRRPSAARSLLDGGHLALLAAAMHEYRTTPRLMRVWRRFADPPDARTLRELLDCGLDPEAKGWHRPSSRLRIFAERGSRARYR